MRTQEKLELFSNMVSCCHNLYIRTYDQNEKLIYSTYQEDLPFDSFLLVGKLRDIFTEYIRTQQKPIILGNEYDLLWIAVPEKSENSFPYVHVMGPFFTNDTSLNKIKAKLGHLQLSPSASKRFSELLKKLPVISLNRIFEYTIMLNYCVTGEKITVNDIYYHVPESFSPKRSSETAYTEHHGTYEAEQEMLRMVREGDLNYRNQMNKISMTGNQGILSNGDSTRQMKNTVLVCVILFSRAAIEGGLSPEISFSLTDYYFQSIEACTSISELMDISHTMQADFVERVHKCRQNSCYSSEIRACMEYIDFHLEDPLNISSIARETGYADYYLSKKFKKETGITIKDYIRNKRIERARFLLEKTQDSLQEIGERLQFCSQSYFTETFRKVVGVPPAEYRDSMGK